MANEIEGVTKFLIEHSRSELDDIDVTALNYWREILLKLGLVGCDPLRYDGYGFGNLSQRTADGFVITGSQTGRKTSLSIADYAEVTGCQLQDNKVRSRGMTKPSSESLTHGAVYACCSEINVVFHVHCPEIWVAGDKLKLPTTPPKIAYGTIAMASTVAKLVESNLGLFNMAGHEDGVVVYGTELIEVGLLLVETLFKANNTGH